MLNTLLTLVGNPIQNDGNTVEGDTINAKKDKNYFQIQQLLHQQMNY